MADIKISELPEETNPQNLFIVAAKEANGTYTSCKYNMGSAFNAVKTVADNITPSDADAFDSTKTYYPGMLVSYGTAPNAKMYRCVVEHTGAWNAEHFTETTAYAELCSLTASGGEKINVTVSGPAVLSGISIVATFFDTTLSPITATTDASGNATILAPIGKEYVLTASDISGYVTPNPVHHIATLASRNVPFAYTAGEEVETVDVTVTLNALTGQASAYNDQLALLTVDNWLTPAIPVFSTSAPYEIGDVVQYVVSNVSRTYRFIANHSAGGWNANHVTAITGSPTALSAAFSTTGGVTSATFSGVPANKSAVLDIAPIAGYAKPKQKKLFIGSSNLNINMKTSERPTNGVLYVDAVDFTEHADPQEILDAGHTCVAIHFTGAVTGEGVPVRYLSDYGRDFYVLTKSLVNQTTPSAFNPQYRASKMWMPSMSTWQYCPNVTKDVTNLDGPTNTYYMANDTFEFGYNSPAAQYVASQTFTYGTGASAKTVHGFLGTRGQWQAIVDNRTAIYAALNTTGFVVEGETRTADIFANNLWTSTQYAGYASTAWFWIASSQAWYGYGTKSYAFQCVPFFAI